MQNENIGRNYFSQVIGYLAIISLIWSDCIWAVAPLRIDAENFVVCPIRTYVGQKIGTVKPPCT